MVFDDFTAVTEEVASLNAEMAAMREKSPVALEIPPKCFYDMQAEFLRYRSRKAILVSFPVPEKQLNPIGVMQGGYMAAAFDNALGPLSYVAAQKAAVSLDISQTYLRAARAGERVWCEAEVVTRSPRTLYMTAAMYDERRKLLATAQRQILIL
ncbi:MAG: PaaI family thioesterase [Turneriella sp.]